MISRGLLPSLLILLGCASEVIREEELRSVGEWPPQEGKLAVCGGDATLAGTEAHVFFTTTPVYLSRGEPEFLRKSSSWKLWGEVFACLVLVRCAHQSGLPCTRDMTGGSPTLEDGSVLHEVCVGERGMAIRFTARREPPARLLQAGGRGSGTGAERSALMRDPRFLEDFLFPESGKRS